MSTGLDLPLRVKGNLSPIGMDVSFDYIKTILRDPCMLQHLEFGCNSGELDFFLSGD